MRGAMRIIGQAILRFFKSGGDHATLSAEMDKLELSLLSPYRRDRR